MASVHQLQAAVLQAVQGVTGGVFADGNRVDVRAAIGWPAINDLQEVARRENHRSVIAVYDRKISKDSTRWSPYTLKEVIGVVGITTHLSNGVLPPLGTVTITLGGTVAANDAVSAVLTVTGGGPATPAAAVVSAGASDTPSSMATKLAAAVNADAVLSTWASAAAVGAVVTLTSVLPTAQMTMQSYVGNIAQRTCEVGRRQRQIQIACWARTEEERDAVANPIESMIASVSAVFGLSLADGTVARILYINDHDIDDATLEDVLRRDFFVSADYAITSQDVLYSVLAPIPQFSVQ